MRIWDFQRCAEERILRGKFCESSFKNDVYKYMLYKFLLLKVVKMCKYRAIYGVYKQLNIFYLNRCPKSPGILGFYDKDVVHYEIENCNVDLRVFLQKYYYLFLQPQIMKINQ